MGRWNRARIFVREQWRAAAEEVKPHASPPLMPESELRVLNTRTLVWQRERALERQRVEGEHEPEHDEP